MWKKLSVDLITESVAVQRPAAVALRSLRSWHQRTASIRHSR
ncbi:MULTISPECIES: hypothetical protein [Cyanophyceae]|nr:MULTISPECIES: hypothetical protein [unclassified Coleofasciculus]